MLSPGAWGFFTADSIALIAVIGQQLDARRKINRTTNKVEEVSDKADVAAVAAKLAADNTRNVSNGFAIGVRSDLKELTRLVTLSLEATQTQSERLTDHERKDHGNTRTQSRR